MTVVRPRVLAADERPPGVLANDYRRGSKAIARTSKSRGLNGLVT
jgi:hypothetical protein